jgi:2-C-methyl-D-erythritol 4-phosphate cytidylyltransferase
MRTKNFGLEPEETLLSPDTVAAVALNTLFSTMRGEVIDVKLKKLK